MHVFGHGVVSAGSLCSSDIQYHIEVHAVVFKGLQGTEPKALVNLHQA
jgi:hypothetical protein